MLQCQYLRSRRYSALLTKRLTPCSFQYRPLLVLSWAPAAVPASGASSEVDLDSVTAAQEDPAPALDRPTAPSALFGGRKSPSLQSSTPGRPCHTPRSVSVEPNERLFLPATLEDSYWLKYQCSDCAALLRTQSVWY